MKKFSLSVALMVCVVAAHAGAMSTKRYLVNAELSDGTSSKEVVTMVAPKKADAVAELLQEGDYVVTATVTAVGSAENATNDVFTKFLGTKDYSATIVDTKAGLELETELGALNNLAVINNSIAYSPYKTFTVEGDASNRKFTIRNAEGLKNGRINLTAGENGSILVDDFAVYLGDEKVAEVTKVKLVVAVPEIVIEPTLGEATLNSHSANSVETASELLINFENGAAIKNVSYAIDRIDDDVEISLASGMASLNTRAFVAFDKELVFVSGHQYKLTVKAWESEDITDEPTAVVEYAINGASATGIIGEPQWGVERGVVTEDQANLGIKVSFPDVVLPFVGDDAVKGTVSATIYGVPQGNEPMPISGEDQVGDEQMGVDGPVELGTVMVALNNEGGVWNAYIGGVAFEAGNHYAIQLNSVMFTEGEGEEEVELAELVDAGQYSVEFDVVATPVVATLGEATWGVEPMYEGSEINVLQADMINLGVPVSFQSPVLPEGVVLEDCDVTVSATLYAVPGALPGVNPLDEDIDPEMGVDGPQAIADCMVTANVEGGIISAHLFAEQLEVGKHYAIVLNAVTVAKGDDIVLELGEDEYVATDFVVIPEVIEPSLGEVAWGVQPAYEGAEINVLTEDMINLGVPVSFPDIVLPEDVDLDAVTATISASLYEVPAENGIGGVEPLMEDENMGVTGPICLAEAKLHNATIDATGLHANLFPEMLEAGKHYAIMLNAVTVEAYGETILELGEDEYIATDFVVIPAEPTFEPFVTIGGFGDLSTDMESASTRIEAASEITIEGLDASYDFITVVVDKMVWNEPDPAWGETEGYWSEEGVELESDPETWMTLVTKNEETGAWTVKFANPEQTFDKDAIYRVRVIGAQTDGDVENWWSYDAERVELYFIGDSEVAPAPELVMGWATAEGPADGIAAEEFAGVTVTYPGNNIVEALGNTDSFQYGALALQVTEGYIYELDEAGNYDVEKPLVSVETVESQYTWESVTAFDNNDVRAALKPNTTYMVMISGIQLFDQMMWEPVWQSSPMEQVVCTFTTGEATGINNVAVAKNLGDGKYMVNGKLVIVKNGNKYGANGTQMK